MATCTVITSNGERGEESMMTVFQSEATSFIRFKTFYSSTRPFAFQLQFTGQFSSKLLIRTSCSSQFDGKGIIPLSKCEDLVQVWHPKREGKLKKNDNKRKKNKASTMYVELEKTCHIEKDEKGRVVSKTIHFGNFASLCKENRR